MNETPTAPRASAKRPSRGGKLTRIITVLAVVATVGALSSVVTAALAVSSFYESRRLRAQLAETRIGIPATLTPSSPAAAAPPPLDSAAWDALPLGTPIELSRAELDSVFGNMEELSRSARIVPAFENGRSVGFKLFSIRATSFYAVALKLENGDVVRRVNGIDITSPDTALEVYAKLKDAKELRVDIARRGAPMRLDYVVTP